MSSFLSIILILTHFIPQLSQIFSVCSVFCTALLPYIKSEYTKSLKTKITKKIKGLPWVHKPLHQLLYLLPPLHRQIFSWMLSTFILLQNLSHSSHYVNLIFSLPYSLFIPLNKALCFFLSWSCYNKIFHKVGGLNNKITSHSFRGWKSGSW